jgi:hypothetical protein
MNKPCLEIKIVGQGVEPSSVSIGDLADVLVPFERAVLAMAGKQGIDFQGEAAISLVDIEKGSERLFLAVNQKALNAVQVLSLAIANQTFDAVC